MGKIVIITPLADAARVYREARPAYVISLLSEDESPPVFDGLAPERHIRLIVRRESCSRSIADAARVRAQQLVAFAQSWSREGPVLIHCERGVSRSTAAALIILAASTPPGEEARCVAQLRAAAPFADPCPLLVGYGDELLGRDGRLIDALEALPEPAPSFGARPATIALAA